ncbi:uncharacterized protein LOC131947382 isoform X2 [Physella acuta]|uniref:uncharacterized protein LOC131947382 isoform X2 n=2 Tax=Physella acuta TaxID=109671 RepID=UPI0027DD7CFC|nr:uncharacterized protein LOC131947382 isoform X2 [Physella acuta]XP_059164571.1 uncharacterized protein LOC131947382 isoform X2 [Physella acuta]
MRSRIQVKHVTEHMKYLEEQIQVMEPTLEAMNIAVEKSKTWIEDKNDNLSVTYIELYQELESATTALLDAASQVIHENKEHVDVDKQTPSFSKSTPQITATEELDQNESTHQVKKHLSKIDEILSRLEQIETAISSLQDANDKSTDDISEIKQWRDNFATEQCDMGVNIEQLTKKQKQNFKNLRKQMSEQDNKVKELNKEMQDNIDKIESLTQEIKRHSDQIVSLEENTSTKLEGVQSKHNVMYKLLQQRLMPIDKLIQIFNQNLETREESRKKLHSIENTISNLSKDVHLIESRVCNTYHAELAIPKPVSAGSIISAVGKGLWDKTKTRANWLFYNNEIKSEPDGDFIDNIHRYWKGDYRKLERHHGYIQWLFPIREHGTNRHAQPLQLHEAEKIKSDPKALQRVLESYRLMLDFYGMELVDERTGKLQRSENYRACFDNLSRNSHNLTRITQILKSLGELGYEHLKKPFLEFVLLEALVEKTLTTTLSTCENYWIGIVRNDDEMEELYQMIKMYKKWK